MANGYIEEIILRGLGHRDIFFRNFSGKESRYNRAGTRNFNVSFDEETAKKYAEQGWNVSPMAPVHPNDPMRYKMKVNVRFDNYPPKIFVISSAGKVEYTEAMVSELDRADIKNVDMIITPSRHEPMNANDTGVTAYLKSMYVTLNEDPLALQYADVGKIPTFEEVLKQLISNGLDARLLDAPGYVQVLKDVYDMVSGKDVGLPF